MPTYPLRTDKDIEDHFEERAEFYCDNWAAGFEGLLAERQKELATYNMLQKFIGDPDVDTWIAAYHQREIDEQM